MGYSLPVLDGQSDRQSSCSSLYFIFEIEIFVIQGNKISAFSIRGVTVRKHGLLMQYSQSHKIFCLIHIHIPKKICKDEFEYPSKIVLKKRKKRSSLLNFHINFVDPIVSLLTLS